MVIFVLFRSVIVVEHDLAILEYISDRICFFYGIPGISNH